MNGTHCTNSAHSPGQHDATCMPPADPSNANLRLLRAIFGLCPNCNETAPHLCPANAQTRRQNAIGMLSELYVPGPEYDFRPDVTRTEIAGNILKLGTLGRTARWQAAVKQWAAMVSNPANNVRWAFMQGMVYAGHASD